MSNIDWSQIVTAKARAEGALREARIKARQTLADALDAHAEVLSGERSLTECLSWQSKEQVAHRLLADCVTAEDIAPLQAEADQAGETVQDLAQKIVAKAASFRLLSGHLAGLRRRYDRYISEAKTASELGDLQASLAKDLEQIRADNI